MAKDRSPLSVALLMCNVTLNEALAASFLANAVRKLFSTQMACISSSTFVFHTQCHLALVEALLLPSFETLGMSVIGQGLHGRVVW